MSESGRLLLVDDDHTFCTVFSRALVRQGFSVAVAHDIDKALEAAAHMQPTHAVVDLHPR